MTLLKGKKALILGVANKRSIAWGVAKAFREAGADIAITYFMESNAKRVLPLADSISCSFVEHIDVSNDSDLKRLSNVVREKWGTFDIIVHSIAFAPTEDLQGRFCETSKAGFFRALDISAYSLINITNHLKDYFNDSFSIIAMTYYGSQKVLPSYKVMGVAKASLEAICRYLAHDLGKEGVRVNCISSGPIQTLAATGVPQFGTFLEMIEEHAPLHKNVTTDEVGKCALFLASEHSSFMTGQVLFIDSGISIMCR